METNMVIKKPKGKQPRGAIGLKMSLELYQQIAEMAKVSGVSHGRAYLVLVMEALEARGVDMTQFRD